MSRPERFVFTNRNLRFDVDWFRRQPGDYNELAVAFTKYLFRKRKMLPCGFTDVTEYRSDRMNKYRVEDVRNGKK